MKGINASSLLSKLEYSEIVENTDTVMRTACVEVVEVQSVGNKVHSVNTCAVRDPVSPRKKTR